MLLLHVNKKHWMIPLDSCSAREQRLVVLNILRKGWFRWWMMVHLVALAVCQAMACKHLAAIANVYKIRGQRFPCDCMQIILYISVSYRFNFFPYKRLYCGVITFV